ncbi:MAG: hypothetical protein M0D57_18925 [Sphingobacteriales bacterium JAD_PAG50586_3]|nr:MAG: hypothetical protein M0D57_18925 [Sphingobacteriales bacterium JAD_PAG50586_3]
MKFETIQEREISTDQKDVVVRLTPETEAEKTMLEKGGDDLSEYFTSVHNALTIVDARNPFYKFTVAK